MITESKDDEIYIGKQAGAEILKEIKNAERSVKVVSPYLSPDYVKELVSLHKKGRAITLVTADNIEENSRYSDFRVSDLVEKKEIFDEGLSKERKNGMLYSFLGTIISLMATFFSFLLPLLLYPSVILLLGSLMFSYYYYSIQTSKLTYTPLFRIKVFDSRSGEKPFSTELIHSKIFIIDEKVCFLGSVNFTYSGFKTHYETAIKVKDLKAVKDISKEVEALYNSKELRSKPVEEWMR